MSNITVHELKQKLDNNEEIQIIDIREIHEVDSGNMGGLHIPMASLLERIDQVEKEKTVVIHCKSGSRSQAMVHILRKEKGLENVLSLKGGIEAWAKEIDPSIMVY
ncbi:MAG: rhodanese-like domain-containing protein [Flavobacteriales bacterium]|nr:rhodanese-like domain-containing protein [Flavobacteriales bacterium]